MTLLTPIYDGCLLGTSSKFLSHLPFYSPVNTTVRERILTQFFLGTVFSYSGSSLNLFLQNATFSLSVLFFKSYASVFFGNSFRGNFKETLMDFSVSYLVAMTLHHIGIYVLENLFTYMSKLGKNSESHIAFANRNISEFLLEKLRKKAKNYNGSFKYTPANTISS